MADIATISAVLGSIKTAHDLAKVIKTSSDSLEKAEIRFQLAELVSALAEAKMELADIQSVIIEKDEEIKDLQDQLVERRSKIYEAPYYWLVDGDERDGPFCQKCKDVDNIFVRLQSTGGVGHWQCRSCNQYYRDSDYVPQPRRHRTSGIF
ncbi:hypothetical protein [Vibrio nigripulchritudo]|uniref:hypothetical protein n=1 Tax=Vibrio nigripulchritudo TaxID=28173 RepID=UPI0024907425|nr:hypothetical protein [Vibrio nigripulchritudo]BDU39600.1 hypothetical protein TUMSATVNIG2_40690 [Vibrio nigripulchritudo]BDU45321.1 hypothetical protein TUMSATVNIG3_41190 [Vibrio nigripulchritudo]